jgi:hypothetical protein
MQVSAADVGLAYSKPRQRHAPLEGGAKAFVLMSLCRPSTVFIQKQTVRNPPNCGRHRWLSGLAAFKKGEAASERPQSGALLTEWGPLADWQLLAPEKR